MKMEELEIKDVTKESIDDIVNLCIPPDKTEDPLFIEGIRVKSRWANRVVEKYGSIGKLAYIDAKPVGMIQYLPRPEEKLVEITCIFVPEKEVLRKGVGKSLLKALIADMNQPKPYFGHDTPLALVTWAFQVPGWYPQHEFYSKMGFKKVREDDPFLLYYPIKEGFVYAPKKEKYIPQEEDRGRATIFYDPSCPWCIYFSEKIKESIREVAPAVSMRMINQFEEPEEVKKRGKAPFCIVNQKPIETFFLDKENFQREVKEALKYE